MIDFKQINETLMQSIGSNLGHWFPSGKINGREFCIGDLSGTPGQSLRINLDKGIWSDFSSGETGGDLISLYAAMKGISQGDAAKELNDDTSIKSPNAPQKKNQPRTIKPQINITLPPAGKKPTSFNHKSFGKPHIVYEYKTIKGSTIFFLAKYIDEENKKQFIPFSYSNKGWVMKAQPAPRPLYGLEQLSVGAKKPVLIVEGEKAAHAAQEIVKGKYIVLTWPGGSNAVSKIDWSPVYGRSVLIWPDNDAEGIKASDSIAKILDSKCPPPVKILTPEKSPILKGKGDDADDALNEGMDWAGFINWGRKYHRVYEPAPAIIPEVEDMPDHIRELPPISEPPISDSPISVSPVSEPPAQELQVITTDKLPNNTIKTTVLINRPTKYEIGKTWESLDLDLTQNGMAKKTEANLFNAFTKWDSLKDFIWYDDFFDKIMTNLEGPPREWDRASSMDLTVKIQRELNIDISPQTAERAAEAYAYKNRKNAAQDWLNTIKWDGTKRIDNFFQDFMGVEDSDYTKAVSKNFWVSMVARILSPGCKVDNMVILEGGQGKRKSFALNAIGGEFFAEINESIQSKDFFQSLTGKILLEISELDAFNRSDRNTIKKVVSCQVDRYRKSYGRTSQDHPRKNIFVGTTNEQYYLKDPTGNRRFWPLAIGTIDVEGIKLHRDLLFAEAVSRFKANETWWEMPESAKAEQLKRRDGDVWEDCVREWMATRQREGRHFVIKNLHIGLQSVIGKDTERMALWDKTRMREALIAVGYVYKTVRWGFETRKVFVHDDDKNAASFKYNALI